MFDAPGFGPFDARHYWHHGQQAAVVKTCQPAALDVIFGIGVMKDDGVILRQRRGG